MFLYTCLILKLFKTRRAFFEVLFSFCCHILLEWVSLFWSQKLDFMLVGNIFDKCTKQHFKNSDLRWMNRHMDVYYYIVYNDTWELKLIDNYLYIWTRTYKDSFIFTIYCSLNNWGDISCFLSKSILILYQVIFFLFPINSPLFFQQDIYI